MEARILGTLKAMAWERVKGELNSMLQTSYARYLSNGHEAPSKFVDLKIAIGDFIEDIEDRGLHEGDG